MTTKCKFCGRQIDKKDAYMVIKGPKKEFYCSKEEYENGEAWAKKNANKENAIREIVKFICDDTGFDEPSYTALLSECKQIAKINKIYWYLHDKKEYLRKVLQSKNFKSAASKIKYLTKIILNKIGLYVYEETKDPELNLSLLDMGGFDYKMYDPKTTPRKGIRRSFLEIEEEYGDKQRDVRDSDDRL